MTQELESAIAALNAIQNELAARVEQINGDRMYSDDYKTELVEKAHAETVAQIERQLAGMWGEFEQRDGQYVLGTVGEATGALARARVDEKRALDSRSTQMSDPSLLPLVQTIVANVGNDPVAIGNYYRTASRVEKAAFEDFAGAILPQVMTGQIGLKWNRLRGDLMRNREVRLQSPDVVQATTQAAQTKAVFERAMKATQTIARTFGKRSGLITAYANAIERTESTGAANGPFDSARQTVVDYRLKAFDRIESDDERRARLYGKAPSLNTLFGGDQ